MQLLAVLFDMCGIARCHLHVYVVHIATEKVSSITLRLPIYTPMAFVALDISSDEELGVQPARPAAPEGCMGFEWTFLERGVNINQKHFRLESLNHDWRKHHPCNWGRVAHGHDLWIGMPAYKYTKYSNVRVGTRDAQIYMPVNPKRSWIICMEMQPTLVLAWNFVVNPDDTDTVAVVYRCLCQYDVGFNEDGSKTNRIMNLFRKRVIT